jgi:hypothetical protein
LGHRLSADLQRVTLIFPTAAAQDFLSGVAASGRVAAIFSLPRTHESLQVKGSDGKLEKAAKTDLKLIASQSTAFLNHLAELGYPAEIFKPLFHCEPGQLSAVSFSPQAAYSQTPGPGAGQAVGTTR